jgi:DNA-binding response OmpR family regulator
MTPDTHPLEPARVLIVDDDRNNRHLLEVMLGPEGVLLMTASSGEEALALIDVAPPDLILLDVMMPGLDGFEVVRRLKANEKTRNIPVILVTALSDRASKHAGLEAGADDFLSKPVDRAELCTRVKNLLSLKAYADFHERFGALK